MGPRSAEKKRVQRDLGFARPYALALSSQSLVARGNFQHDPPCFGYTNCSACAYSSLVRFSQYSSSSGLPATRQLSGSPVHLTFWGCYFRRRPAALFHLSHIAARLQRCKICSGGHIDLMFVSPDVSLPHVRDGTIKAYAATARSRLPAQLRPK